VFAASVVVADLGAGAVDLAPEDPAGLVQAVVDGLQTRPFPCQGTIMGPPPAAAPALSCVNRPPTSTVVRCRSLRLSPT
jgi:hypothetical protein